MANKKFVPPPERVDDLSEWEKSLDVPHMVRDLPRGFYLRIEDLRLKEPIGLVLERFARGSEMQQQEARKILGGLQLVVLNLMLFCSGYDYGKDSDESFIHVGVKQWDTGMLTGNEMYPRNFGNFHEISRQSTSSKYDTPLSPSEGWMFRMIDFKENFLKVVQSLNFFEPADLEDPGVARRLQSPEHEYAVRCIQKFLPVAAPAA